MGVLAQGAPRPKGRAVQGKRRRVGTAGRDSNTRSEWVCRPPNDKRSDEVGEMIRRRREQVGRDHKPVAEKPKAVWATPPRRTAPTDPYQAETWLCELADWLSQQDYDLGVWFAEAVHRRNESGENLERLLGLLYATAGTPSIKERPRSHAERRRRTELALDAHPHVTAVPPGKKIPWKVIARAIGYEGRPNDLRKWYDEFYSQAEDIARRTRRDA